MAFNFFRQFYRHDEAPACQSMAECFVFNLHSGLRAGGGVGDELEDAVGHPLESWRVLFDLSFFFVVVVVLLAIVQVIYCGDASHAFLTVSACDPRV